MLCALQHDLDGPLNVFEGFLGELSDCVSQLDAPLEPAALRTLIDEDFRPCLACMDSTLLRMREAITRLHALTEQTDAAA